MAKLVFEENQKFDQWWVRAILIVVMVIMIRMLIRIFDAGPLNSEALLVIMIGILPILLITMLLFGINLQTRIDENGIEAKFHPISFSKKRIAWTDIKKIQVIEYSPLMQYGGWGYRISFKNGKAMNVKGNKGIKLFLQNGKQFLIGTQRPKDAEHAIGSFFASGQDLK